MTKTPVATRPEAVAVDVLKVLKDRRFTSMPVVDKEGRYKGVVTIHSIIKAGIVG